MLNKYLPNAGSKSWIKIKKINSLIGAGPEVNNSGRQTFLNSLQLSTAIYLLESLPVYVAHLIFMVVVIGFGCYQLVHCSTQPQTCLKMPSTVPDGEREYFKRPTLFILHHLLIIAGPWNRRHFSTFTRETLQLAQSQRSFDWRNREISWVWLTSNLYLMLEI